MPPCLSPCNKQFILSRLGRDPFTATMDRRNYTEFLCTLEHVREALKNVTLSFDNFHVCIIFCIDAKFDNWAVFILQAFILLQIIICLSTVSCLHAYLYIFKDMSHI